MRVIVVGLGIQGKKRVHFAGKDVVATVDIDHPDAKYRDVRQVPLVDYDAALVCTPDGAKLEILRHLLTNGKHALVEKPLIGPDNAGIKELITLATANRVSCYTAYNHRFEPHIVRLKEALDAGRLGQIYQAKFFYGNGTARDVRNSPWRDKGTGILPDLGSHLLDMVHFLFGEAGYRFQPWSFDRYENKAFDHMHFASRGPHTSAAPAVVDLEATLLSWRNNFRADIYAEHGSAHISSLCKWGPSSFTMYQRILPSGRPNEETITLTCPDPTWQAEYAHFKRQCTTGASNLRNDLWINDTLNGLTTQVC